MNASPEPPSRDPRLPHPQLVNKVGEVFGLSRAAAAAAVSFSFLVFVAAVFFFIRSAPPTTVVMAGGPPGSIFDNTARKYAESLAKEGVKLRVVATQGSVDNMRRLESPHSKVDVAFVQDGLHDAAAQNLISLGSVSYQPLLVFYRGAQTDSLAGLAGKRVVVGPESSGTHSLALTLLDANGIEPGGATRLLDLPPSVSAQALLDGQVDAVFLMGEDAPTSVLRQLLHAPGVHLLNFAQAEAYSRRFPWLSVLTLPEGSIDFAKDIPPRDVQLVGPTIELVARKSLHPALSDVILEAAQAVHGRAALFQRQGEFPVLLPHDFPLSADAARYYRSGKSFFYHYLPFWLASLANRLVVVIIPALVIVIPVVRAIPKVFRWQLQRQLYRWYRELLGVEKELFQPGKPDAAALLARLDAIEAGVNRMKMPASFADQFYALRGHIDFVRKAVAGR